MSRHSDALLGDLKPQSSWSASAWLYLILGVLVLGAAERAYRQLAKAKQKRTWELEQRRRHGIPDDDKRPFKIAHRDAAVRARREAEKVEAEAKAERERVKTEKEAERKRALDREWEQVNRETGDRAGQGMRRRAPPSGNAAHKIESTYRPAPSPQQSAASPSFPGAMPQSPQEEQPYQPQYQPQMRQVGNAATSSRKRAAEDEDEDDVHEAGPSRETQRRKIDIPRGTKRTAEDEEDEEEDNRSVAHRAKIRAGKARQVAAASSSHDDEQGSDENDGAYEPSDKENQPIDEDMTIDSDAESDSHEMDQDAPESRTPRQPPQDKGKKRLLSEVDNESVVSGSGGRPKADRKRRKNRDDRLPEGGERFQGSSEEEEQPVTVQRRPSNRQPKATNRPTRRAAPPPATGLQRRDSQIVRKPGDEWTDKAGCKWRWGEDGHKRRNVAVKEIRKRYDMPKDSTHPDANLTMQVLVDKWLTEAEYEQARKDRKLSWQSDEVEEKPTTPAAAESSRGKSLYHLKGSVHPLRASTSMASLVGRVARNVTPLRRSYMTSGSLAGLGDSGSSVPSSPADGSFGLSQSHLRARLVSTPLRGALGSSSTKKPLTEEERKRRETELVRKLTQADKPATPVAPSPAPLPASSTSTPSAPATSAPTFSFGASPAASPVPAGAAAESKPDSKPPMFSFGAAPAKTENATPAAAPAPSASFSFGAGKVEKAEEPKPPATFSFGSSAPPAAPTPPVSTPPAGGAPSFSFGASSTKPADTAASSTTAAAAPASFSFGASTAPAASTAPTTAAPSFSFGAASKSPAPASSTPSAAPATFSFGASTPAAPASSATPSATPSATASAPTFTFGAASSTPAATTPAAAAAPPTFSFGGGGSTPAAAPTSAPSFSFGSSTPAAAPGAPAPAPSFSFGAGGAAPASGGFSFGSGGSTTGSTFSFGKK